MSMHATLIKHIDSHTKKKMKAKQGLGKKVFSGSIREENRRLTEGENDCNFLYMCMKLTKNKNFKMKIELHKRMEGRVFFFLRTL